MKTRDIIVGFIVLVVIVGLILFIRNRSSIKKAVTPSPTPVSIQQKINQTFPGLTVPQNVEQVELRDVTGGQSFGIATRTEILANLPTLASGRFYQAKLENAQGKFIILGNLRLAKGGYLLEYNSSKYPGYNSVIIATGGKTILQGSF